eukprot:SM000089S23861  [mRNA]  locus=s89:415487:418677:+ [translate_table: standard]
MLRHAEAGLTTFDLADIYGPAEELFGQFINRCRREKGDQFAGNIQGLTKWCPPPGRMTRQIVEEGINRSRRRMDVSALDMVQLHWQALPNTADAPFARLWPAACLCNYTLGAQTFRLWGCRWDYDVSGYIDALKHLTDLKEEGKLKTVALTNFDTRRLQTILENKIPVVSNQVQHSIVDMRPQQDMVEICKLMEVQFITYGTLLGGLLSEKYLDSREPNSFGGPKLSTPSLNKYKRMIDAWGGWRLFQELLRAVNTVAKKHDVSISTVGLRYILDQPCVAGSMVGVRLGVRDHIADTLQAFGLVLDEDDLGSIRAVTDKSKDLRRLIGDCGNEYR